MLDSGGMERLAASWVTFAVNLWIPSTLSVRQVTEHLWVAPSECYWLSSLERVKTPSRLPLGSRLRIITDKGDMTTIAAFPTSLQEDTT